jgi:hypothetical protein
VQPVLQAVVAAVAVVAALDFRNSMIKGRAKCPAFFVLTLINAGYPWACDNGTTPAAINQVFS